MFSIKSLFKKKDDQQLKLLNELNNNQEFSLNVLIALARLMTIKPNILKRETLKKNNNRKYLEIMLKQDD